MLTEWFSAFSRDHASELEPPAYESAAVARLSDSPFRRFYVSR